MEINPVVPVEEQELAWQSLFMGKLTSKFGLGAHGGSDE